MSTKPLSPIHAYFAEADYGDSRWFTWILGIWFAAIMWMYSQFIIGIPLFGVLMVIDPDILNKLAASSPSSGSAITSTLLLIFLGLAPVLALVLWFLRGQFEDTSRRVLHGVIGAAVILSSVSIGYMLTQNDAESTKLITEYMGKSKAIYGLILLSFPPIAIAIWLVQKFLHKRSLRSLHTAASRYRWGRMIFSMFVFWAIAGVLSYIAHLNGMSKAQYVFDPKIFWGFAIVSLLLIPLQSATEEIMLRGYLNQALSRFIGSPWIIFAITSAGFASLHLGNPEIAEGSKNGNFLITLSGYFMFGMFACILTYIDGGLETAIGVHAANNLFAATMVGYENSALPTPTVFRVGLNPNYDSLSTIIVLGLVCLVMYLTRRYTLPVNQPALRT